VIDFTKPEKNDFLVVRELWVQSGPFKRRCDLVGFVNGLPLVFIELKRHDKGLKAAFDDNYTDYKDTIPRLFHYNALVIVSNGFDARFGSITSTWDHFYRWKRLNEEDPDPAPKHDEAPLKPILPILLRGMCTKGALLDIVENFTLFRQQRRDDAEGGGAQPPVHRREQGHRQVAVRRCRRAGGQAGRVLAHAGQRQELFDGLLLPEGAPQGVGGYTFVLLTDRKELDDQIYTTFVGCGVSTNKGDKATGAPMGWSACCATRTAAMCSA
jgi:type I restriction enzyme R subunit